MLKLGNAEHPSLFYIVCDGDYLNCAESKSHPSKVPFLPLFGNFSNYLKHYKDFIDKQWITARWAISSLPRSFRNMNNKNELLIAGWIKALGVRVEEELPPDILHRNVLSKWKRKCSVQF